jgi:hypothetical protein
MEALLYLALQSPAAYPDEAGTAAPLEMLVELVHPHANEVQRQLMPRDG